MLISRRCMTLLQRYQTCARSPIQHLNLQIAVYATPDGGYGWIVVAASFAIGFITEGSIMSFSVYTRSWMQVLAIGPELVTFISSTQLAIYFLSGPAAAALLNVCGFRRAAICGSVLAGIGYLAASFTNSFALTLLTYGFLTGLGSGLLYLPSVIILGHYFERYRVIATGIMLCGCSLGSISLTSLLTLVVEHWGIMNALRVQAGFTLLVCVFAMVYRSPPMRVVEATEDKPTRRISETTRQRRRSVTADDALSLDSYKSAYHAIERDPATKSNRLNRFRSMLPKWARRSDPVPEQVGNDVQVMGPMDRMDVYYSGSLLHLPPSPDVLTTEPAQRRRSTVETPGCSVCMTRVIDALNLTMFRSVLMICITFSTFIYTLGQFTPFMYIVERAVFNGIERKTARWLLPSISAGTFVGRIVCGVISLYPGHYEPTILSGCAAFVAGSLSIAHSAAGRSVVLVQYVYCFTLGLFLAIGPMLRSQIYVKYLGLERLTIVFGLVRMFMGFAALAGTPLAQAMRRASGGFMWSFLFSGFCHSLAGVTLLLLAGPIWRYERNRQTRILEQYAAIKM